MRVRWSRGGGPGRRAGAGAETSDGKVYRLGRPWLTLGALAAGTWLGVLVFVGFLLGWFGVSPAGVAPYFAQRLGFPPKVLAVVIFGIGTAWSFLLSVTLVYEVRARTDDGTLLFRTALTEVSCAPGEHLVLEPLAGWLFVRSRKGRRLVLLPELARAEALRGRLELHQGPSLDSLAAAGAPKAAPPGSLDMSLRRILGTDSKAYVLAWVGVLGAVGIPLIFGAEILLFLALDLGPNPFPMPPVEILEFAAGCGFLCLLVVSLFLSGRVRGWRTILDQGKPVLGRIDDIFRPKGEILVTYSYRWAGETYRARFLSRPTPEAKALEVGTAEVVLLRPDRPKESLPQRLFLKREPQAPGPGP